MNSGRKTYKRVMRIVIKLLAVFLTVVSLNAAVAQERQLRTPPLPPGMVQKVAVTNVQTAVRTLLVLDVSTAIQTGAGNAEAIAYWCRAVADTFASMQTNGNFLPSTVMERTPTPLNVDLSALQGAIVGLYARTYEYRSRADLPPLEFLSVIARTFNEAIREGIRQGGKGHIIQ